MSGHRLLAFVAAAIVAVAVPSVASSAKQDKAPPPADAFVGMETCASCHEETVKAFKLTPHARGDQSCESCHGPGKEHVDGGGDKSKIRNFKTLTPPESAGVCMDCHNKGGQKHWVGSSHDAKNVACANCHNPHPKGPVPKALLAKPQQALCTGCHLQRKAQLMRAGHMPLREGKLQCTSCHNPHGTPNDKMIIQASVNQNCYSCHAEKRGPFLWEHAPVRENCMNCHEAHGTVNEKMLRVKPPLLCQQCHQTSSHPGPAYPAQSRYAFNQGCLHCHTAIHGSVHPSGNRFFR